jgi:hypothetical protein
MDNADKAIPEITLQVFGAPHKLSPTFGTFCRFEKATGKNAMAQSTWLMASALDMVTFIWAALGGEKLGKSIDDVAEEVDGKDLSTVQELLAVMFKRAQVPEAAKKDEAA